MASSLSNIVNNLYEGIHKIKCKYGQDHKNCDTVGIKDKYCNCFLEYTIFKNDLIEYKCSCCSENYQQKFDEKLKKQLFNTYKFFNHDNNNFTLLWQIDVCPYEYMDDWENFNETSLPEQEDFYSHLNMEDITNADYTHPKRISKDFGIKGLGEYRDLHIQSNTFLLADVFKNFRNMSHKVCELNPTCFLTAPTLVWEAALKKLK